MTDVYRWAVVRPDGTFATTFFEDRDADYLKARWYDKAKSDGYRVARFKLVECAEGEGE